jgi:hypothetical protein
MPKSAAESTMAFLRRGAAVLSLWLAAAPGARAGVYNLSEPPSRSARPVVPWEQVGRPGTREGWDAVWARLTELRGVPDGAVPQGKAGEPVRQDYLKQEADLERRRREDTLDTAGRVSLGGCLIRLGRSARAAEVLEEGERTTDRKDPLRFLLLLNLAAAYQDSPELMPRAIAYQDEALKAWPESVKGWSPQEWRWNRRVERLVRDLLRLRANEARLAGGRPAAFESIDGLFPGLRFVGPRGSYQAGTLAVEQWDRLPLDAGPAVLQLLLWQPRDFRLFWLYGELLNAQGEVGPAYQVLNFLTDVGLGVRELKEHRSVLAEALPAYRARSALPDTSGAADVPPPAPAPPPPSSSPLPDWRVLLIGFGAGVLVTVLTAFQWRQWRPRQSEGSRQKAEGRRQKAEDGSQVSESTPPAVDL